MANSSKRHDAQREVKLARMAIPSDLNAREQVIYRGLVCAVKVNHFGPADVPLLRSYCRALVALERTSADLTKRARNGYRSPLHDAHKLALTIAKLRVALRIGGRSHSAKVAHELPDDGALSEAPTTESLRVGLIGPRVAEADGA